MCGNLWWGDFSLLLPPHHLRKCHTVYACQILIFPGPAGRALMSSLLLWRPRQVFVTDTSWIKCLWFRSRFGYAASLLHKLNLELRNTCPNHWSPSLWFFNGFFFNFVIFQLLSLTLFHSSETGRFHHLLWLRWTQGPDSLYFSVWRLHGEGREVFLQYWVIPRLDLSELWQISWLIRQSRLAMPSWAWSHGYPKLPPHFFLNSPCCEDGHAVWMNNGARGTWLSQGSHFCARVVRRSVIDFIWIFAFGLFIIVPKNCGSVLLWDCHRRNMRWHFAICVKVVLATVVTWLPYGLVPPPSFYFYCLYFYFLHDTNALLLHEAVLSPNFSPNMFFWRMLDSDS